MLVIKYNCGQGYKNTAISTRVAIVIVQKPFLYSQEICYSRFNFYWPPEEKKEI